MAMKEQQGHSSPGSSPESIAVSILLGKKERKKVLYLRMNSLERQLMLENWPKPKLVVERFAVSPVPGPSIR